MHQMNNPGVRLGAGAPADRLAHATRRALEMDAARRVDGAAERLEDQPGLQQSRGRRLQVREGRQVQAWK